MTDESQAYDRGALSYDATGEDDPAWRARYRALFRNDLRGTRVLEVGCGAGRDAAAFAAEGLEVVGLDGSERLLAMARARCPAGRFARADLRSTAIAGDGHDGIWAMFCLFHVGEAELGPCLRDWRARLREAGVLTIGLAQSELLRTRVVEGWLGVAGNECTFHYHHVATIELALQGAGFQTLAVHLDTPAPYLTEPYRALGLECYVVRARRAPG